MKNVTLLMLVCIFFAGTVVFAGEYPTAKQAIKMHTKAPAKLIEPESVLENETGFLSAPPQMNSILIDSARNGYGFSSSSPKSIDGVTDLFANDWVGTAYRKFVPGDPNTGIIGVAELDVTAGFAYENITFWDYINNMANFGIGGRYPSFLAAPEGPVPIWNQYLAAGTPTTSDAFLSFDFFGWGQNGGGFIPPESWSQNSDPNVIFGLWLGSNDLYKDGNGTYHIGGIWEIDLNAGDYTFIHGTSTDLQSWTWENATLDWAATGFEMNAPRFAWGSNGFGAWISTGYFVGSGDEDFKLMLCTTTDYGQTWSQVQRFEFSDLGLPEQITAQDSIYVPSSSGGDSLYVGDASVGITYDFDLIVLPSNDVHVGCTISWGPYADEAAGTYYPNGLHMGFYDIHSSDQGQNWTDSRIFWNSGLLVGDSTGSWITTNEFDLGYDEAGNIYAAWVDRDRQEVVPTPYPHTNPNLTSFFVQDVWASMSRDGGNTWSENPVRITDDQANSAYGMRMSTRTKYSAADEGKTYVIYQIADLSRPLAPPIQGMYDHVQWYYFGEAKNFPQPATSIKHQKDLVANDFSLSQNYPNPFNPTTSIQINIAQASNVKLTIYNALGQEVETLVNKRMSPGVYEINWNASEMASGIYLYRLETDNFSSLKKMVLLK